MVFPAASFQSAGVQRVPADKVLSVAGGSLGAQASLLQPLGFFTQSMFTTGPLTRAHNSRAGPALLCMGDLRGSAIIA